MYGLISKITARMGKRDELGDVLVAGAKDMPGCVSYVVAQDNSDADAIWVTEIWVDQASHQASLKLPSVVNAMAKGRPLIAGFGDRVDDDAPWSNRARARSLNIRRGALTMPSSDTFHEIRQHR